jgi:transposase InsO family protein
MTLPPQLLKHNTLMLAILTLARQLAEVLEVDPGAPLAQTCRDLGANRTSVYEQLQRLLTCLGQLLQARAGRPTADAAPEPEPQPALTIEVLEYRIHHPGAVIDHPRRTTYADAFRRFVLEHHDRWQGTLEAFAKAVRVPLDTLRDWIADDRAEDLEPRLKTRPSVPANASQLTRLIVDEWMRWVGPARPFIAHAAQCFELSAAQVARLMKILAIISSRPRRTTPRDRGSTQELSPGTMLVTDGKWLTVQLTASEQTLYLNWQGIVDQTTGCDTAAVVTPQEDATAVQQAFVGSVRFLGGCVPDALLHDNKPCYDDQTLQQTLKNCGTDMIPATLGRAQNKAILEGAFGLFQQRVGNLRLDDTDDDTLIRSAVQEIVRAYTAATNHVPRIELDGRSRLQALQDACPTDEQRRRDEDFLARLKADHRRPRSPQPRPESLKLIEHVFERFELAVHDPNGKLRRYLATFSPAAIRRAAAVLAAKIEHLDRRYAHRYLTQVIRKQQDELDLERAAEELLELCQRQRQDWTHDEQQHFEILAQQHQDPAELAAAVAQRAAFGGLPLQATFWKNKLLELLDHANLLADRVKNTLIRLYEAPKQQRLALLDLVTAHQHGLR